MTLQSFFRLCTSMLDKSAMEIPYISNFTCFVSFILTLTLYMDLYYRSTVPYIVLTIIVIAVYYFSDRHEQGLRVFLENVIRKLIFYMSSVKTSVSCIKKAFFKRSKKPLKGYGRSRRRLRRDDQDRRSKPEILERKDDDETSQEGNDHSAQEFPSVPEPTRKNSRRQKKKRNSLKFNKSKFKGAMDDSSETSSNSDRYPKIETRKETTKVYQPLTLYTELNLKFHDLYHEFKLHVLTLKQLDLYSFPKEMPDRPGHIFISPKLVKGSIERHCYRCGSLFDIHPDGRYEADSVCHYHPMKQKPLRKGQPYHLEYPCCNGNYMSQGCLSSQYHVTAESYLHDVQFVRARKKKHLNEIDACTVYAVDCEMLFTTAGMEVCKVGIVGLDGLTVYESFVLPQNKILHYNTVYSGVAEKDLKGVSTTLKDVQAILQKHLNKESILVGHGLENDLKALRFIHEKIVDTSVVFPHPHGAHYKKSLKALAKEYLNKDIQGSVNGHDSIEDARTCMELMLYKINDDLKNRPPLSQDENRNAILQNISLNPPQPQLDYPVENFSRYQTHRGNYYTDYDFFRNHFYSGYFMSKEPRVVY